MQPGQAVLGRLFWAGAAFTARGGAGHRGGVGGGQHESGFQVPCGAGLRSQGRRNWPESRDRRWCGHHSPRLQRSSTSHANRRLEGFANGKAGCRAQQSTLDLRASLCRNHASFIAPGSASSAAVNRRCKFGEAPKPSSMPATKSVFSQDIRKGGHANEQLTRNKGPCVWRWRGNPHAGLCLVGKGKARGQRLEALAWAERERDSHAIRASIAKVSSAKVSGTVRHAAARLSMSAGGPACPGYHGNGGGRGRDEQPRRRVAAPAATGC